jgi:hypothetical protein
MLQIQFKATNNAAVCAKGVSVGKVDFVAGESEMKNSQPNYKRHFPLFSLYSLLIKNFWCLENYSKEVIFLLSK